ncbi:hypothetical protein KQH82_08610 [bacterium]|nr:hypothetical protein [bacterium]
MVRIKWAAFALAAMALVMLALTGCEREITGEVEDISATNCFGCHNGQMDAQQGEWANSIHASGNNIDYTNRGGSDCTACHNQEGFLSFIATGTLPSVPFSSVSAIGCFTCHNPHAVGDFTLRATAAYTLPNGVVFDHQSGNLCVNCHHSRTDVRTIGADQSVNSRYGPHHGPQGEMVQGTGGYEFPGGGYTFPSSPHAGQVREACIGCHMGNARAHEGYDIGGHSFNMIDEESGYDLSGICANESCHPGVNTFDFTADFDYDNNGTIEGYRTEIHGLIDSLDVLLQAAGVLSGSGTPVSGTVADAGVAGALYNRQFIEEDRSFGVHNFSYSRSLLEASIDYMNDFLPAAAAGNSDGPAVQPMVSSH